MKTEVLLVLLTAIIILIHLQLSHYSCWREQAETRTQSPFHEHFIGARLMNSCRISHRQILLPEEKPKVMMMCLFTAAGEAVWTQASGWSFSNCNCAVPHLWYHSSHHGHQGVLQRAGWEPQGELHSSIFSSVLYKLNWQLLWHLHYHSIFF